VQESEIDEIATELGVQASVILEASWENLKELTLTDSAIPSLPLIPDEPFYHSTISSIFTLKISHSFPLSSNRPSHSPQTRRSSILILSISSRGILVLGQVGQVVIAE